MATLAAGLALAVPAAGRATDLTARERSFLHELNAVRRTHGLEPVRIDDRLERAARFHTSRMLTGGWFAHGRWWWQRLVRFGADAVRVGENLGWTVASPRDTERIVRLWLASPEHRAVILHAGFDRAGIGVGVGAFKGWDRVVVVTVDFAGT